MLRTPFQTSIGNGAFGLLFLNPPYDWEQDDKKRVEHAFLTHCTRYLVDGGVLVFIVPRQLGLAVSARFLSAHYTRVRCWAFPDPEREAFDQVVLMAIRRTEPSPDGYTEAQIKEWAEGEPDTLDPVTIPRLHAARHDGRGGAVLKAHGRSRRGGSSEARRSGLWANPQITDALWPAREDRTRPLMPLRRGHMAMLVAAGFLDNLQLEADGQRILVKGRTSKEMILVDDTPEKEVFRERLKTTVVALGLDDGEITDIAA